MTFRERLAEALADEYDGWGKGSEQYIADRVLSRLRRGSQIRLRRDTLVLEMCECRQHPRSIWVEWVLRSWALGRAYLMGLAVRPPGRTPIPAWFYEER